jgi:polyisoprenoid-binding protein YceI
MNVRLLAPLFGISALLLSGHVYLQSAAKEFTLKDDKGANGLSFSMDDGIEPVFGFASGIEGAVMLDLENPEKSSGKVIVKTDTLKLTQEVMSGYMKGEWCLDVEHFPDAVFEVKTVKVKKNDKKAGIMSGTVSGDFTFKGITKPLTAPVTVKFVPGGVKTRFGDKDGDLIVFSTEFSFNRFEHNVGKTVSKDLLSDKVNVRLNCAGMAYTK